MYISSAGRVLFLGIKGVLAALEKGYIRAFPYHRSNRHDIELVQGRTSGWCRGDVVIPSQKQIQGQRNNCTAADPGGGVSDDSGRTEDAISAGRG